MNAWKRRTGLAVHLALVLAMVITSVGLADTVHNDVNASGIVTITTDGSTIIDYWITAAPVQQDGQQGCNAADGSSAIVTINVPPEVNINKDAITFSACGGSAKQSVEFSSSTPGQYPITVSVADTGQGSYSTDEAEFTLIVNAPPSTDTTPPVITPSVVGTLGNNGWYTSAVTVSWTVVDDESAISSTSGCGPTTIDTDTEGTTLTCTATSAGGTASKSVPIKRDATAPTANANQVPVANVHGWNKDSVTVTFTGEDNLSGIASCSESVVLSEEGAGQFVSGTCTDKAGNVSAEATATVNIDKTPPTVALEGDILESPVYYYGFVPDEPTCEASDALSGLDGACEISGYSDAITAEDVKLTVRATAYDKAGNKGYDTHEYQVLAWTLTGFYQPVDMGGVWNTVKGGSTVPLKFEIFAGSTELTDPSFVTGFSADPVPCEAGGETAPIEVVSAGNTSLRYDVTTGQFIYNWKTPKLPGKCYVVTMTTQDGSFISADFKLK